MARKFPSGSMACSHLMAGQVFCPSPRWPPPPLPCESARTLPTPLIINPSRSITSSSLPCNYALHPVSLEPIGEKTPRDSHVCSVRLANSHNRWMPPRMPPVSIVSLANTLWRQQAVFAWTAHRAPIPPRPHLRVQRATLVNSTLPRQTSVHLVQWIHIQ